MTGTMQTKPLFSVLIANYNNGRFLQDAIDSVLAQTYNNWEIIIVDDKSTDNSFDIYEKYKDNSRFYICYNDENQGCGYTKRRCAEIAHGEICGFLDPDDTLENNALDVMVDCLSANADASMVYSRLNCVDLDMHVLRTTKLQNIPAGESLLTCPCWSSFVAYKKEAYLKTVGINALAHRAVDNDLCYKLEEVGTVLSVNKVLYNYRISTGNNISMGGNAYKAFAWQLYMVADACKRRGIEGKMEDVLAANVHRLVEEERLAEADKIRSSYPYRLGRTILRPFIGIKKIINALR